MRRIIQFWQCMLVAVVGCQSIPSQKAGPLHRIGMAPAGTIRISDTIASSRTATGRSSDAGRIPDGALRPGTYPSAIQPVAYRVEGKTSESGQLLPPMPITDADSGSQVAQGRLTLAELESIALSRNPAVAEASARVQAFRGKYLQVGLRPNPTAGYTASEIGDDGAAGQQGAFLGQEFVTGGKLRLNREAAGWEVQRADQEMAALQQRVLTDVRVGYYELLIAQERLAMTEKLAATGQQGVDAVQALLAAQEASGTDLLQAQVEAETANMLVENARASRFGAWNRLAAVLGDSEFPMADVAGDVATDLPAIEFDSALGRILADSPLLSAQYAEIERARWAVQRACAEVIPNVTVQGMVQYDYGTDDTIAGLQIGLPLPIINRNQGGIQEAHGELVAAEQAVSRLQLALRKRLATVYQQYQTARQQVDRYSEDILPKVDETLRLTNEGYRAGEFGFLQLLTSQRTYFQTHLAYLDALGQMWSSSRQIEGLLLSDSLESGPTGQ